MTVRWKLPIFFTADRHQEHCKAGMWSVWLVPHPNLGDSFRCIHWPAVVDDFGNLVRV